MKSRAPLLIVIAIVAGLVGVWSAQLFNTTATPTLIAGTVLPNTRVIPNFKLTTGDNQPFTLDQFKGHWSVLYFGYTNCPDVCPTTLSTLKQVATQLDTLPAQQQPQYVFISVDPQRDTPAQMQSYVNFYRHGMIGLTGEPTQLDILTHALGVPIIITPSENGSYTVDHSANLYLLNPQGELYALFTPPFKVDSLAQDLRSLVAQ